MFTMLLYLYFSREKIHLSAIQDVRFQDKSQILFKELKMKIGFSGAGNTSERSWLWTPMAADENSTIIK